jgi:hypothetical protein
MLSSPIFSCGAFVVLSALYSFIAVAACASNPNHDLRERELSRQDFSKD